MLDGKVRFHVTINAINYPTLVKAQSLLSEFFNTNFKIIKVITISKLPALEY